MEVKSFINTLDAVFKRDDLRGVYPEAMNAEVAMLAGCAFAKLCGETPCIAVGYDARLSSPELSQAVCRGVALAGGTDSGAGDGLLGAALFRVRAVSGTLPRRGDGDGLAQSRRIQWNEILARRRTAGDG